MRLPVVVLLVLLLTIAGCGAPGTPSPVPTTLPPVDTRPIAGTYPLVDGSTSTYPLAVLAKCKITGVPYVWSKPIFTSERVIVPNPGGGTAVPFGPPKTGFAAHTGTHQAYVNLVEGKTDLVLVARAPSEDEKAAARARGVSLDVQAIALDGFVFLVNAKNPASTLTLEQIRAVFTGRTTDWGALGASGPVKPYTRDRNSGSQELMDELVLKGAKGVQGPDLMIETMMGLVFAVAGDAQGIGYSVFYYANFMLRDERTKMLAVEGVAPTTQSIASRTYPLTTEVYAVLRAGTPKDSTASRLRDWFLTTEGKAAVAESGYVPMP